VKLIVIVIIIVIAIVIVILIAMQNRWWIDSKYLSQNLRIANVMDSKC
jgi:preprotein translocase subunit SecG